MRTKSGVMVGLGETMDELVGALRDLRAAGCDIATIGQYLQPHERRLPVEQYYTPDEFDELRREGERLGFLRVEAGPLVRSSYHAQLALSRRDGLTRLAALLVLCAPESARGSRRRPARKCRSTRKRCIPRLS